MFLQGEKENFLKKVFLLPLHPFILSKTFGL
jgi:hypothetical protein